MVVVNLRSDTVIRRAQSIACYFFTIFIFCYIGQCGFAVFFSFFGVTLFAPDERAEDLAYHAEDYVEDAVVMKNVDFDDTTVEHKSLAEWEVTELLENVLSDPRLPQNYLLISSYLNLVNTETSNKFFKIENQALQSSKDDKLFLLQKRLFQSKLQLNTAFAENFQQRTGLALVKQYDLLRFKGAAIIANTFIIDSYIATGIYSTNRYDFELYLVDSIPLDCLFLEYTLMLPSPLKKIGNSLPLIPRINNTKTIIRLVNAKLAPNYRKIHNFLDGEKSYD